MSKEKKDLLSLIESGMSGFSKGQKRIAGYILEHYDKAAYMTASKLGTIVGISESTVVRFAIELGFDGCWWRMTCDGRTDEDSVRAALSVSTSYAHAPFDFPAERAEKSFRMPGLKGWRPRAWNASSASAFCFPNFNIFNRSADNFNIISIITNKRLFN